MVRYRGFRKHPATGGFGNTPSACQRRGGLRDPSLTSCPERNPADAVALGWYGNARGRNDWSDCDALLSVGDPHANLGSVRAIASVLGMPADRLFRHVTAAELSQVSGRLRAPWRLTPALHLHVGTVAPLAWDASAEVLELPRGPAEVLDGGMAAQAVHVYGSQRLAAADLGVRRETVNRALSGARKSFAFDKSQVVTCNTIRDLDGLRVTTCDTAESHGNVPVSARPFDDAAQFDLLSRAGGVKSAAEVLGVSRATVYHWATARNTRRMPDDARERLEMHLAALETRDDSPTAEDLEDSAHWTPDCWEAT